MAQQLTHVDSRGAARMVDVSAKSVTVREATATGRVRTSAQVVALLRDDGLPKGDALAVARVAGIAGAKRTPDLVPLCHPVALHAVTVRNGLVARFWRASSSRTSSCSSSQAVSRST